jgi:hypothetical protein
VGPDLKPEIDARFTVEEVANKRHTDRDMD